MIGVRLVVGALLLIPTAALGQDASGCAKFKWSVAREQNAFAAPDLPSIASGQVLPANGAAVALQSQAKVAFVQPSARPAKVDPAYAAVLPLTPVTAAGTYEVTLSAEAWIDMLQNGTDIRSSGFTGQPDCADVRKSVRFALKPGPATLQISGASAPSIKVEVLPVE